MSVQDKINRNEYSTKLPFATYSKDPETWAAYHNDDNRLREQFKKDALKECGIQNHPKAEVAWAHAWAEGHSNGFSDVLYYLELFAEVMV